MKGTAIAVTLLVLALGAPALPALELDGTLDWSRRVELGTLVSGVVREVPARSGAAVRRGDPLLQLDDRGFDARLAQARAAVALAEARLAEAGRERERARELYDRTVLSDHELQLAEIGLTEARLAAEQARSEAVQAGLDLEHSLLRAPFDGRVVAVYAQPGQAVVSDLEPAVLVVLGADRPMLARAELSAAQLKALPDSPRAQVSVAGRWLEAEAVQVDLEPRPGGSGAYPLRVLFQPPQNQLLRPGLPVRIRIGEGS